MNKYDIEIKKYEDEKASLEKELGIIQSSIDSYNEHIESLKQSSKEYEENLKNGKVEKIYKDGYFSEDPKRKTTYVIDAEDASRANIWIEEHCIKYHKGKPSQFSISISPSCVGYLASCVCDICKVKGVDREECSVYIGEV